MPLEGKDMRSQRFVIVWRRLNFGLALGAILLASGCQPEGSNSSSSAPNSAAASAAAAPPAAPPATPPSSGRAGVLDASWIAPTTNADGSPLTDLAFYRLYYDTASTPCPASAYFQVASTTSSPQINKTVAYTLTGLLAGTQYFVAVTAVDSSAVESACSSVASAVARSASGSAGGLVGGAAGIGGNGGNPPANQAPALTLTGLTADLGPQLPGAAVTFTATASGGTAPYQFKWWLWDGATWTVLEDWSNGNAFAWIPSTPNPNYAVEVWARSAGNADDQPDGYPANLRAYGTVPFAIN